MKFHYDTWKKRIMPFKFCFCKKVTWYRDSVKLFETDRVLMTVKGTTWTIKLREVIEKSEACKLLAIKDLSS